MAPHSSTLAWKIPWTEQPGRLQSMGLLRVGHDWNNLAAAAAGTNIAGASVVAQSVKNLLAVQETWVRSLGWEDPLEKKMATHSSIIAWKISWTEKPGGLQSMGSQRVRHHWVTNTYLLSQIEWSKSEGEKQILHINTYMEPRKMVQMNLFAGQE